MKQFNNVTIAIFVVILSFLALFFSPLSLRATPTWRGEAISNGIAAAAEPLRNDTINKFGIHILEPSDLPKAQELINSSGGDWGWVTVVIRDDDMNHDKWQSFMDECRVRHLIPLVRIATHLEGENWAKPKIADANSWANFLNSLNWPISDQYVIIFNEPNHTKEWGGEINPQEYARILSVFIDKFHSLNSKFIILNSGFDLAAGNTKTTMDSYRFMQLMNQEVLGIFETLDGWASHSYPNHGYLGKPWETGKHSIQGYKWELAMLKNELGLTKDLPVFITETGWPKSTAYSKKLTAKRKYYSEKIAAEYIKHAFENVWLKDEKITAVTPFVLNYPGELFADFSWLDKGGNSYKQYEEIQSLNKTDWKPVQEFKAKVLSITLPPFLPINTEFKGKITLKNTGQSIWGEDTDVINRKNNENGLEVSDLFLESGEIIKPGEKTSVEFTLKPTEKTGETFFGWEGIGNYKIKIFPSSTITSFRYNFWQKVILKIKSFFN